MCCQQLLIKLSGDSKLVQISSTSLTFTRLLRWPRRVQKNYQNLKLQLGCSTKCRMQSLAAGNVIQAATGHSWAEVSNHTKNIMSRVLMLRIKLSKRQNNNLQGSYTPNTSSRHPICHLPLLPIQYLHQRFSPLFGCQSNPYNKIIPTNNQPMMNKVVQLVQSLTENGLYRRILSLGCSNYAIRPMKLETITPAQLFQHLRKTEETVKQASSSQQLQPDSSNVEVWSNNEFKIFAWISVCYSYLAHKSFSLFDHADYQFLRAAFPQKSTQFLCYNLRVLTNQSIITRRPKWTQEETKLLQSIMRQQTGEYKWTQISFQLFLKSDGELFQTPQKCREQWINHLNPEVNKEKWTVEEDILLLRSILREGKKWSHVSKMYNGSRTEHMVKNRYKSLLHRNQFKAKKVSEKKFCQNLLLFLQAKSLTHAQNQQSAPRNVLRETQAVRNGKGVSVELVEMRQSQLTKIQSQTEHFINQQFQCKQSIEEEQQKLDDNLERQFLKGFQLRAVQLREIEFFQQIQYKTEEDIYLESLLS